MIETLMSYGLDRQQAEITAKLLNTTDRTEGQQEYINFIRKRYFSPATKVTEPQPETQAETQPEAQAETATETEAQPQAQPEQKALNDLIDEYQNFIPVYELANALNLSYKQLWNWIYSRMRTDKITTYSIQESHSYTLEQLEWRDSQGLFFVEFPIG